MPGRRRGRRICMFRSSWKPTRFEGAAVRDQAPSLIAGMRRLFALGRSISLLSPSNSNARYNGRTYVRRRATETPPSCRRLTRAGEQ